MRIHGLTVCVNFADLLAITIERWKSLASLTIVTDLQDAETVMLGNRNGCAVYRTDAFTRDGATFNKGRAMEEARRFIPWHDWCLFFDADIYPPADWAARCESAEPGNLYSAQRLECPDIAKRDQPHLLEPVQGDGIGVGFFQLFNTADPVARAVPLLDVSWKHAGGYDCTFKDRWPEHRRRLLPFQVVHLGERENWFGRGSQQQVHELMANRSPNFAGERIE